LRRLLVTANVFASSPIVVTLILEMLRPSETSVLTRATRRTIAEDAILQFSYHICDFISDSPTTLSVSVFIRFIAHCVSPLVYPVSFRSLPPRLFLLLIYHSNSVTLRPQANYTD
jgi:uncharacterized protein YggT (Ycf19 family)